MFRVRGNTYELKELKEAFDRGERPNLGRFDINCVASLLKSYLNELPEPLVPTAHYEAVMRVVNRELPVNRTSAVVSLAEVITSLPPANYDLLLYIIRFLRDVAQHASANKMTVSNLAIIFCQTVITPEIDDSALLLGTSMSRATAVSVMIEEFERLFPGADGSVNVDDSDDELLGSGETEAQRSDRSVSHPAAEVLSPPMQESSVSNSVVIRRRARISPDSAEGAMIVEGPRDTAIPSTSSCLRSSSKNCIESRSTTVTCQRNGPERRRSSKRMAMFIDENDDDDDITDAASSLTNVSSLSSSMSLKCSGLSDAISPTSSPALSNTAAVQSLSTVTDVVSDDDVNLTILSCKELVTHVGKLQNELRALRRNASCSEQRHCVEVHELRRELQQTQRLHGDLLEYTGRIQSTLNQYIQKYGFLDT